MAVPAFFYFIRPALELAARQPLVRVSDVMAYAGQSLGLTESDKEERVAGGSKTRVYDRSHWALTYLRQAQLLRRVASGVTEITDRGREFILRAPNPIRPEDLEEFPEFVEFKKSSRPKTQSVSDQTPLYDEITPKEAMDQAYQSIREELADTLLTQLKSVSPSRFEEIIVELMLRLGYGGPREDAGESIGRSGDGGVDGIIRQDMLGLDNIYLQAKRYTDNSVGTGEVNSFIGALTRFGASKGVLITTSTFSDSAKRIGQSVPHLKLSMIDGRQLALLMLEHDLGVSLEKRYDIKRLDSDYFSE